MDKCSVYLYALGFYCFYSCHWILYVLLLWLQIYEKKLQQYQDNLSEIEGSHHDWSSKRTQQAEGVENVKTDLDNLNRQYIDQVLWANRRLQDIKDVFTENNIDIQVNTQATSACTV